MTQARNGGDACPQLVETQVGNMAPCSKDCELSEWSEWALCSKMCGGGTQQRQRKVLQEAIGDGLCTEEMRLETQTCNPNACAPMASYKCAGAREDIVLVMDASGAVTLEQLAQLKALGETILTGYDPNPQGANVGLVTMGSLGVSVAGLESDLSSLTGKIQGIAWQDGASNLGSSLMLAAMTIQRGGRRGAFPTIVVLFAGRLADAFAARQSAKKLRRYRVRIVLAVVGSARVNPRLLQRIATDPASDLLFIPSLEHADEVSEAANKVITGTCSSVVS